MIVRRMVVLTAAIALVSFALALQFATSSSLVYSQAASQPGPGVQLKILGASMPADQKPVVNFSLTDASGNPLRLADVDANSLRFIVDVIQPDPDIKGTKYVSSTVSSVQGRSFQVAGRAINPTLASAEQAVFDPIGTFSDQGGGKFTYKFSAAVPGSFDPRATHTIGAQVTRNARAFVSNDVFSFVPAGGDVQTRREVATTAACNACHDRLALHGGQRVEVGLCILCHTSQTVDPESGNTVDFKVMIHKIHAGHTLQSVEAGETYRIVGFGQNVFDFGLVRWPQDTRNCQTCHQGAQADNFKNNPSAEACGACHDKVNFQTGQNHPAGPQPNSACGTCHTPDGPEFGLSVTGAHTIPEKSSQLRGVNFEIVSFTNTGPGQSPTVVFNIKDRAGQTIQPSEMSSLSLVLGGPTFDYTDPVSETATRATPTGDGNFSYTFQARIPENAAGSYAVGIQGYLTADVKSPSGQVVAAGVRDAGFNKVAYGAVTDAAPMPRKQVVDIANCNRCHERLALHGGSRLDTEFCVLCHNPTATDVGKRTTARGPMPPESVNFPLMIHKIHTGEELTQRPYIIYGGSPSSPGPLDMSEALYPTDRRNCTKCHVPNSQLLDFARTNVSPTIVRQDGNVVSALPPVQSACMGCHDSSAAKAHGESMTGSNFKEACAVCHNENREWPVSKAHSR